MYVLGDAGIALMERAVSYSELRKKLKTACDEVCDRHEPLLIKRRRGGDVVLIAKEDFDSLEESAFLLSSPENAMRLSEALRRRSEDRSAFASIAALKHEVGA
jgi:antitoxin YefM